MVDSGIVQMPPLRDGAWPTGEPSTTLWKGDRLSVVCPPPSILIASKMARASDVDMDDATALMMLTATPRNAVVRAAATFPTSVRSIIRENITLLDVMVGNARVSAPKRRQQDEQR